MCEDKLELREAPQLGEYVYRLDKLSNLRKMIDSGGSKSTGPAPSIQKSPFVLEHKKKYSEDFKNILSNKVPSYKDIPAEPALAAIDGWDIPQEDLLHGPWLFFFTIETKALARLDSETRVTRVSVQSLQNFDWYSGYYVDGAMCTNGSVIYFPCKGYQVKDIVLPTRYIEVLDEKWVGLNEWKNKEKV